MHKNHKYIYFAGGETPSTTPSTGHDKRKMMTTERRRNKEQLQKNKTEKIITNSKLQLDKLKNEIKPNPAKNPNKKRENANNKGSFRVEGPTKPPSLGTIRVDGGTPKKTDVFKISKITKQEVKKYGLEHKSDPSGDQVIWKTNGVEHTFKLAKGDAKIKNINVSIYGGHPSFTLQTDQGRIRIYYNKAKKTYRYFFRNKQLGKQFNYSSKRENLLNNNDRERQIGKINIKSMDKKTDALVKRFQLKMLQSNNGIVLERPRTGKKIQISPKYKITNYGNNQNETEEVDVKELAFRTEKENGVEKIVVVAKGTIGGEQMTLKEFHIRPRILETNKNLPDKYRTILQTKGRIDNEDEWKVDAKNSISLDAKIPAGVAILRMIKTNYKKSIKPNDILLQITTKGGEEIGIKFFNNMGRIAITSGKDGNTKIQLDNKDSTIFTYLIIDKNGKILRNLSNTNSQSFFLGKNPTSR